MEAVQSSNAAVCVAPVLKVSDPQGVREAIAELDEQFEKVSRARSGFKAIPTKIAAAREEIANIDRQIAGRGGLAEVRLAMGLAEAEESGSGVMESTDALRARRKELEAKAEGLEAAQAAGSEVFQPILDEFHGKWDALNTLAASEGDRLFHWAKAAIKDLDLVRERLIGIQHFAGKHFEQYKHYTHEFDVAALPIDPQVIALLNETKRSLARGHSELGPLVPPPPPPRRIDESRGPIQTSGFRRDFS
jgi:hypothetical protein